MEKPDLLAQARLLCPALYGKTLEEASPRQRYLSFCAAIQGAIAPAWTECSRKKETQRRAYYLSMEFLMGRAIYNNLYALGRLEEAKEQWAAAGFDPTDWELEEDAALGNGGLGRLAACFLDSAATLNLPLDGYGLRFRYGLFRQQVEKGCQREEPDDWSRWGDPWSLRREEEAVTVSFGKEAVRAVPYDMPVIGFGGACVNTLRLWQSEALEPLDLEAFQRQDYQKATRQSAQASLITSVLYPNDSRPVGKKLRLRQEYFLCSASMQDLLRRYKKSHGSVEGLAQAVAVQLNDTHPILSMPELLRLLLAEGYSWEKALAEVRGIFSYTNHTIMAEALERWGSDLLRETVPQLYPILRRLDKELSAELERRQIPKERRGDYALFSGGSASMANVGSYLGRHINGVAQIHSQILKKETLAQWEALYPGKILNETNGITPRRWLGLSNPRLSALLTRLLGSEAWLTDLGQLEKLRPYADDPQVLREFIALKAQNKADLAAYLARREGVQLDPSWLFDIQVKRFHEYKRQTMNALGALALYFRLKEGQLPDFQPTVLLFGGKAAPGYVRAKGAIKLIHEVAKLIDADPLVRQKLKVVFVRDYNVSYAQRLIPAADLSEQISTAGTEASGTSNMKFMANGTPTLGTLDGANIEIVARAGEENNYIFGLREEQVSAFRPGYEPKVLCKENKELARVVEALVDGTLQDEDGLLAELHHSLLEPSYNSPDHYLVLAELPAYLEAKLQANRDYKNTLSYARKGWLNLCASGPFSSDETIRGYARDIWQIEPLD